jgi:hypothetical protein
MTDVDVTLRLPESLVEKARAQGVLRNERIARLLAAEVERVETWTRLNRTLAPAREAFRADHPDMTEDDMTAMLNDLIDEGRTVKRTPENPSCRLLSLSVSLSPGCFVRQEHLHVHRKLSIRQQQP